MVNYGQTMLQNLQRQSEFEAERRRRAQAAQPNIGGLLAGGLAGLLSGGASIPGMLAGQMPSATAMGAGALGALGGMGQPQTAAGLAQAGLGGYTAGTGLAEKLEAKKWEPTEIAIKLSSAGYAPGKEGDVGSIKLPKPILGSDVWSPETKVDVSGAKLAETMRHNLATEAAAAAKAAKKAAEEEMKGRFAQAKSLLNQDIANLTATVRATGTGRDRSITELKNMERSINASEFSAEQKAELREAVIKAKKDLEKAFIKSETGFSLYGAPPIKKPSLWDIAKSGITGRYGEALSTPTATLEGFKI